MFKKGDKVRRKPSVSLGEWYYRADMPLEAFEEVMVVESVHLGINRVQVRWTVPKTNGETSSNLVRTQYLELAKTNDVTLEVDDA